MYRLCKDWVVEMVEQQIFTNHKIRLMFKAPFSFSGRIRRTEYGISYLVYIVLLGIIAGITEASRGGSFLAIAYIPMLWFLFAQGAKRCHDRGHTGWYQIIPFYVFWMLFAESKYGPNEYGPNPKGLGNHDDIDEIGKDLVG